MLAGYTCNVSKGISLDLSKLTKRERKALVKFISRVSEVSYRRGFQQSYAINKRGEMSVDPCSIRYKCNIDKAPRGEDGVSDRTAIDVLKAEYHQEFANIKLYID